jgi:hypothetical protein
MTTARTGADYTEQLRTRYRKLQALKQRVDAELTAVENGLRVAGVIKHRGTWKIPPTHTAEQAREAHRRWQNGERDDTWVAAGERQYQRESKRRNRSAA